MHPPNRAARALLALLLAALPCGAGAVHLVEPSAGTTMDLTPEERAWLAAHPVIRVGNDPGWVPIDFDNEQGQPVGVAADMLKLIEERLGVRFEAVPGQTWAEA